MNESKSLETLNARRWGVLCNRVERASQADFEWLVRMILQARNTSSEVLTFAIDAVTAEASTSPPRPSAGANDIKQIEKEIRDAAGDFQPWGQSVLEGFADRLAASAVQASEARGDGSLRTALGILRDLERKHHGTTECSDLVAAHTQAGPVD